MAHQCPHPPTGNTITGQNRKGPPRQEQHLTKRPSTWLHGGVTWRPYGLLRPHSGPFQGVAIS